MLQTENDFKTARAMITQQRDMLNALHTHSHRWTHSGHKQIHPSIPGPSG